MYSKVVRVAVSSFAAALAIAPSAFAASVTQTVSPSTVNSGDVSSATQVLDPGSVANPTYENIVKVSGSQQQYVPGSAQAPANSTIAYSNDGITYGPADSTSTRFVKFGGPISSAAGAVAPVGAAYDQVIAGDPGGDGYAPMLTPTRVYNVNHHHTPLRVECHVISTGALCPGYATPYVYTTKNLTTPFAAGAILDAPSGKIWVPAQVSGNAGTEIGFACISVGTTDTEMPSDCGWVATGTGAWPTRADGTTPIDYGASIQGGASYGRKIFSVDTTGKLHCLDMASGVQCAGAPYSLGLPVSDPIGVQVTRIGDTSKLIVRANLPAGQGDIFGNTVLTQAAIFAYPLGLLVPGPSSVSCFDAATMAKCSGWTSPQTMGNGSATANGGMIPIQVAGNWDAFCSYVRANNIASAILTSSLNMQCLKLDGTGSTAAPAALNGTSLTGGQTGWTWGWEGLMEADTFGTKVYFTLDHVDLASTSFDTGRRVCFDFATDALCGANYAWTSALTDQTYATRVDDTGTCIWSLGDTGQLVARDAADPTKACRTATASMIVNRADSYCGQTPSGADGAWGEVKIRNAANYGDAFVTIRDADGVLVTAGATTFDHVKLGSGQTSLDISSIPYAGSTTKLSVVVQFTSVTGQLSDPPASYIEVTWDSTALPQTCIKTKTLPLDCPTATEAMGIDSNVTFTPGQGGASATASDSDALTRSAAEIAAGCGSIKLDKAWKGTASQVDLKIGTSSGGSQIATVTTGASGAAPQTTGTQVVNPGGYYVSESSLTGYDSALTCESGGQPVVPIAGMIVVAGGSQIVCTYTNTQRATVTVKKVVSNPGDTSPAFGFETDLPATAATATTQAIVAGEPNTFSIKNGEKVTASVSGSGSYSVYETDPSVIAPGYRLADISCEDVAERGATFVSEGRAVSISTKPGSEVVCTYTNKRIEALDVVVKKPKLQYVHPEDTATYTYDVSNNGSSDLHDIVVTDDKCSPVTLKSKNSDPTPDLLNPGETWTYTCSITAAQLFAQSKSPVTNTVTVKATDELDRAVPEATDTAQTILVDPKISVVKSPVSQAVYRDDTASYSYVVSNDGNTTLSPLTVTDDKCAPLTRTGTGSDATPSSFDPGDKWSYSCSVPAATLFPTDQSPAVTNTVTATGIDRLERTVSATDKALTTLLVPGIAIDKQVAAASVGAKAGDAITFNIAVTNTGNTAFTTVALTDDLCPTNLSAADKTGDATPGQLDPAETWRYTCVVQTTAAQAGQRIVNTAKVDGTDTGKRVRSATDDASIELPAATGGTGGSGGSGGTGGSGNPTPVVGKSRISGSSGCVKTAYASATVVGNNIKSVAFTVNGKKFKTLSAKNTASGFRIRWRTKMLAYGTYKVRAKVTYVTGASPASATLSGQFNRCRPKVVILPRVTG